MKICGVKTRDALEAVIGAGASHFGLVFFPKSPRNVSVEGAARLIRAASKRIASVALTVDASDVEIEKIAVICPDMLQLHGSETPERARNIRECFGLPVIKAISVSKPGDAERAFAYEGSADLILFDAKPPQTGADVLPGGNGLSFDWRLLWPIRGKIPFMLSGGLTPGNVADAIALTGAGMVDVSSGVESAPGVKDPLLINSFIEAATMAALKETANEYCT